MSNLKLEKKATKAMRNSMTKSKKVKITINFDVDILDQVKKLAESMGYPLNKLVKDSLVKKSAEESKLDRLEKEIKAIKKKVA